MAALAVAVAHADDLFALDEPVALPSPGLIARVRHTQAGTTSSSTPSSSVELVSPARFVACPRHEVGRLIASSIWLVGSQGRRESGPVMFGEAARATTGGS
jgi:hypothetical protein